MAPYDPLGCFGSKQKEDERAFDSGGELIRRMRSLAQEKIWFGGANRRARQNTKHGPPTAVKHKNTYVLHTVCIQC